MYTYILYLKHIYTSLYGVIFPFIYASSLNSLTLFAIVHATLLRIIFYNFAERSRFMSYDDDHQPRSHIHIHT